MATSPPPFAANGYEELAVDFVPDFRFVGLLNDDTTPVGRVHVGPRVRGGCRRPAGRDPGDREAERCVRARRRGRGRRRSARDLEPDRIRIPRDASGATMTSGDRRLTHRSARRRFARRPSCHRPASPSAPSRRRPRPGASSCCRRPARSTPSMTEHRDGLNSAAASGGGPSSSASTPLAVSLDSTHDIVLALLDTPVPAIVWVAPPAASRRARERSSRSRRTSPAWRPERGSAPPRRSIGSATTSRARSG